MRGPQIMKGYLNQPGETAACLDREGWYHTGDVGYVDDDGFFFIVDRTKELIKYKGLQVAPAELEALLVTHPAVLDAAVVRKADEEAGEVPKAFVVLKADDASRATPADAIMGWVAERVAPTSASATSSSSTRSRSQRRARSSAGCSWTRTSRLVRLDEPTPALRPDLPGLAGRPSRGSAP